MEKDPFIGVFPAQSRGKKGSRTKREELDGVGEYRQKRKRT